MPITFRNLSCILSLFGGFCACTPVAEAEVLLELLPFSNAEDSFFREPKAWLEIQNDAGKHAEVTVKHGENESILVNSPLPIPCDDRGRCAIQISMRPQKATFRLRIEAADRCGARFEVVHFESITATLRPYESNAISFQKPDYQLDDDGDNIVNYAELLLCGRPDWDENGRAPEKCAKSDDPCCTRTFAHEGQMVSFAGGTHRLADGRVVPIPPFWLDATEVTWRQFKRCVAAGVCLADAADHPVRLQMDKVTDLRLPVTGLNPAEAGELCEFYGKRLVRDREFDFAVAHREGSDERARYPWDDDDATIDCQPIDGKPGVAANFSAPGTSCPGTPLPVGSYPSSYVYRGPQSAERIPAVDLAGNVSEWTVATADDDVIGWVNEEEPVSIPEVPPGITSVYLRGGGWHSPAVLLENDLRVEVPYSELWSQQIARLAQIAGFRCAIDETDYIGTETEPACGDLE